MSEKGTILIIDDEPDLLKVLVKRLKDAGYDVVAFGNALEGLAQVKNIMPSLIILDVVMPEMDGMQLKKKLNEDEAVADIPVIFLTAKDTVSDKVAGFDLAADDFVTKPFAMDELVARIESVMRRWRYYEGIAKASLEMKQDLLGDVSVKAVDCVYDSGTTSSETFLSQVENACFQDITAKKEKKRAKKIILIVDDEEDIRRMLAFRLRQAGFIAQVASDGEKALEIARRIRPDLIILDITLPHISGQEVCKAVREDDDEEFASTPIIMLTARSAEAERIIGKVIGANYYMTKPFDFPDVLGNIQQTIGVS
jgi:DNA-binding response OmpR family regulator